MLVSEGSAATWGRDIICTQVVTEAMSGSMALPQPESALMSEAHVATKGCVDD